MDVEKLGIIADHLKEVLEILQDEGLTDKGIRSAYAEYHVAYQLANIGHTVQIRGERERRSADIYLKNLEKGIEVKSGVYDEKGGTDASFGKGTQITNKKFHYCVFVTFEGAKVVENFIFSLSELKEISTERPAAKHKTNPCLLFYFRDYNKYLEYLAKYGDMPTNIETSLIKNPENFLNRWDKIV